MKIKMNYLLKSSNFQERRKIYQKKIWIIVAVLIILIIILSTAPAKQILFSISQPIWELENYIASSSLGDYFKFKQSLINENIILKQKLFLTGDLAVFNDTLQNENATLKDLLGRKETKVKTILATVLVKPPRIPYDTLIVDVGKDNNVNIGDKVIANANVYIGEVSEVNAHSSKITLYSTPGRKLSVTLGADSVSAEALGAGGGNFIISLPREIGVKEGDSIVIPSIMPNIFGIIEKVDFKDKDSFQTIIFKSPANISELSLVEIVLNN